MHTLQTAYNKVKKHLLNQKKISKDESGKCLYRGPNNLKCAVGALIPNKLYYPGIENKSVSFPGVKKILKEANYPTDIISIDLYFNLQRVHDTWPPSQWERELKYIAQDYKLKA